MKQWYQFLLSAICLFAIPVSAAGLDVWTNKTEGIVASAFELQFETNNEDARIFWTREPNASPAEGLMFTGPIPIDHTETIHFFAFTPEPDVQYTEMKKATFIVESKTGYEHFRIIEVNPQSGTVTLRNFSKYPVNLVGWKLESRRGEYIFPDLELASGETISRKLAMRSVAPRVLLRAPNGNAEQIASMPVTKEKSVWRCTTRISATCRAVVVE